MYRAADLTHYRTLQVEPGASLRDIRSAYHRASLKAHPDHGGTHHEMLAVSALTPLDPVGFVLTAGRNSGKCSVGRRKTSHVGG